MGDKETKLDLSVIIPYFNGGKKNTILTNVSLLEKATFGYEIIVVDDGSKTPFVCNDKNIRVIATPNGGVSKARNVGIENSNGKYLFFLDSDDLIHEDLIVYLNNNIIKENSDWVLFNFLINLPNNQGARAIKLNKIGDRDDIVRKIVTGSELNECWGKLIRRKFLIDNHIFFSVGCAQGEDAIFNVELLLNSCAYSCVDTYSYIYNFVNFCGDDRFISDPEKDFYFSAVLYSKYYLLVNTIKNEFIKRRCDIAIANQKVRSCAYKFMLLKSKKGLYKKHKAALISYLNELNVTNIDCRIIEQKSLKIYLWLIKHKCYFIFGVLSFAREVYKRIALNPK